MVGFFGEKMPFLNVFLEGLWATCHLNPMNITQSNEEKCRISTYSMTIIQPF